MRCLRGAAACAFAFAAIAMAAPATAGPPGDWVKGNGENNPEDDSLPIAHFQINVRSEADGSNPTGVVHVMTKEDGVKWKATPTCLTVAGDTARIVVAFERTKQSNPKWVGAVIRAQDNGDKQDGADEIRIGLVQQGATPSCDPADPDRPPLNKGDIRINDEVPLP